MIYVYIVNPAIDYIQLSMDLIKESNIKVELISTEGKIKDNWIINSAGTQIETQLPIGHISKGIYLVKILSSDFSYSKTILIQ